MSASALTIGEFVTNVQFYSKRKVKFRLDGNDIRFKNASLDDAGTVMIQFVSVKKSKSRKQ